MLPKKTLDILIICVTVIICVAVIIANSPFRMYVKDCMAQGYYEKDFCVWMYMEMRKDESWLRNILLELGR
jgi:hypothetical protein